jgi:hypothetical protein
MLGKGYDGLEQAKLPYCQRQTLLSAEVRMDTKGQTPWKSRWAAHPPNRASGCRVLGKVMPEEGPEWQKGVSWTGMDVRNMTGRGGSWGGVVHIQTCN